MNPTQARALQIAIHATLDAVKAGGDTGAPGGALYAAMMRHGASLSQFQSLMNGMVNAGFVTMNGECYHLTDKGEEKRSALEKVLH